MTILTKNFDILTAQVAAHVAADQVVQGTYWDNGRGCFIGCLSHSSDPTLAVEQFGLTLPLLRIAEGIFEALPAAEARAFFAALPAAVGCDGKDLSRVHWAFLAAELRALPVQMPEIDTVIAGMDLLAAGEEWPDAYAARAARAAYAAAHAAADAAAHAAAHAAAYAAAHAAYAAQLRQRDTLLRLIAEAPVVTQ